MDDNLKNVLKSLDEEWKFQELRHAVNIAQNVRKNMKDYGLDNKDLSDVLNIPESDIVDLKDGTHAYDIRTLSRLETFFADLKREEYLKDNKILNVRADEA